MHCAFWSGWVFVGVEWEEGMFPVWCPCVVFHNIARRCRVRWSTRALATCQLSTKSLTRSLWMLPTISNEIRKWRCCFAAYANENHMFWQQEFLGYEAGSFHNNSGHQSGHRQVQRLAVLTCSWRSHICLLLILRPSQFPWGHGSNNMEQCINLLCLSTCCSWYFGPIARKNSCLERRQGHSDSAAVTWVMCCWWYSMGMAQKKVNLWSYFATRHKKYKVFVPELVFGHLLTSDNYDDSERPWNACKRL